ncbi:DedA family protein [Sphingomonas montana]|uniref:DedA family protein n=1 Tax=Sphingomonas montana TaxID=1843236 RepID=UPI00096D0115|nr:DedA family protein [Sphingomonas montana]
MSIESLVAQYGLIALFVGAGLEGETVVLTGGVLAHRDLVPLWGAALAAAGGSFTSDQVFFALGRRYRDHPRVRRIMVRPAFARALRTLERHPVGFILAFRFLYGLRTVSPVAIGTSQVPALRFVVLNAVAALLWAATFTGLGYAFGEWIEELAGRFRAHLPALPTLLAAAAGIAAVATGARFLWVRHVARMPEDGPG